ncbi:UDP-glucose 4-epimerase [Pseudomonas sp. IT-P100]|uniref:UDP-glucose 4-epimerase family protein n=1 Tax=Pseudomonas sp. IT-P100 TaxID=3026452 RepID=UPI0039E1AA92
MRVMITGSSGFVGTKLVKVLADKDGIDVLAATRHEPTDCPTSVTILKNCHISAEMDWTAYLSSVNVVIHTAARVHIMDDRTPDPMAAFRAVNVQGTMRLAEQAAEMGVQRFIFLSSVKVNGEETPHGEAYTADQAPAPADPYGVSKMEAESQLRTLAERSGMEVVIIRPVLVYGPGVKANFLKMMKWIDSGVPLPFGAIHNSRSLVALDNLVDLIVLCIDHPRAANQTFMVSDGEDLSSTELMRRMARALNKPARLFPVPVGLLTQCVRLIGKPHLSQRLCGSLKVDTRKTLDILDWKPVVTVESALKEVAAYFQENNK